MKTETLTIALKQKIFDICLIILSKKNSDLNNVLLELTDELKNDTKSSMGDKHETSRAMNQLEQEKVSNQIIELNKQLSILHQLNIQIKSERIISGSLIKSNLGLVFIAVGLGKIKVEQLDVISISAHSPLGNEFLNKTKGDTVLLNNIKYTVDDFI